jgi:arginine N-succinyltransferase
MVVIRPVTIDDLDQFEELATIAGFGLTTLPKDRELLQRRVLESEQAFKKMSDRPAGESYLFVMEDLTSGRIVGTCGIVSKVGGFEPFYAYRIETSVHESKMLDVHKEIKALHLVQEHNGPCEIGSLFLAHDYRKGGNGRLLSLSRFLFMAEHREFFDPRVIAEMRGVLDENGGSPFWDALGRHFFEIEYPKADYLSMVNKKFIADLMPTHPIYIPLLPPAAQEVIGQVHTNTRPALRFLEEEGFQFSGMVDIFEAGPVMECPLEEVRTVRESHRAAIGRITDEPASTAASIIAAATGGFRACMGAVGVEDDSAISLDKLTAMALGVKVGDTIRYAPMRSTRKTDKAS